MSQPFKVHELLTSGQLAELEQFAREPGRTINECREWLGQHGFELSQTAVWNWLRAFKEQLLAERFRRSSDLAMAIKDAAQQGSAVAIGDAAILQLCQVVFEQAAQLEGDGRIDAGDLLKLTMSLQALLRSKAQAESLKAEFENKQQAALREAAAAASAGATGQAVVDAVRKALGIS